MLEVGSGNDLLLLYFCICSNFLFFILIVNKSDQKLAESVRNWISKELNKISSSFASCSMSKSTTNGVSRK